MTSKETLALNLAALQQIFVSIQREKDTLKQLKLKDLALHHRKIINEIIEKQEHSKFEYYKIQSENLIQQILTKMSNPKVDIKLGTSLVEVFDGTPEKLESFIDSVSLFKDAVDADFAACQPAQIVAARKMVAKFIKTRLTGTARQAIPDTEDVEEIMKSLQEKCKFKVTSDNMLAKLKGIRQKADVDNFCEEVEKLTSRLQTLYVQEGIPGAKAETMATKCGVDTLIRGVKNAETKTILKAGNFTSMNAAIQKLQENDVASNGNNQEAKIFFANRYERHNSFSRGYARGRGANRGIARGRPFYRQYQNRDYQQNHYSQNYQRSNNNQNNNNFQYRGRGRGGNRVFYVDTQQMQNPQLSPQPWPQPWPSQINSANSAQQNQQQNANGNHPFGLPLRGFTPLT